jgi:hypothetical protein
VTEPGLRMEHTDEYTHRPDELTNFNESVYVNGFDPRTRVGAWMRLGNRVNEGYAELSVVLYLPGGRIAVAFGRPEIMSNDEFEAGGLSYHVTEPLKTVTMGYAGEVLLPADPGRLRDPGRLFKTAPRARASVQFTATAVSPIHGGEPTAPEHERLMYYGPQFSRGHFNQHTAVKGTMSVGEESWEINGFGWRDHSWGPRYWQAIWAYRLFLVTFAPDRAFMLLKNMYPDGTARRMGVLLIGDDYEEVTDLDLLTTWSAHQDPESVAISARTANRKALIEARVLTMVPLRNRRRADGDLLISRVAEGFTEYTWEGLTGYGMMEYIERVEDGSAVGYPL